MPNEDKIKPVPEKEIIGADKTVANEAAAPKWSRHRRVLGTVGEDWPTGRSDQPRQGYVRGKWCDNIVY